VTGVAILRRLEAAITNSWRALLQRVQPDFGIGKQLTREVVCTPSGCYLVSASFEGPVKPGHVTQAIAESRSGLRRGAGLASIIQAASHLNVLIGLHLVAGQDHHLMAVIPAGRVCTKTMNPPGLVLQN
jgi:hypothetical protein